ncbi:cellulose synthase-like protein G3 [Iris pallida]|uniref:Cellulose synthase-like protein G3 n=1 Tax=Iris pallida TaxID=29817 RepID=A0AAX6H4R7_IRIPA|nr:cellulose synthase-like protein G3 [Iris pallida]
MGSSNPRPPHLPTMPPDQLQRLHTFLYSAAILSLPTATSPPSPPPPPSSPPPSSSSPTSSSPSCGSSSRPSAGARFAARSTPTSSSKQRSAAGTTACSSSSSPPSTCSYAPRTPARSRRRAWRAPRSRSWPTTTRPRRYRCTSRTTAAPSSRCSPSWRPRGSRGTGSPSARRTVSIRGLPMPTSSSAGRDGYGSEKIRLMYQSMKEKVESTVEKGFVSNDLIIHEEEDYDILKKGKGFSRRDHPSTIQVLLESGKDCDINGNAMPNLIYVSREKSSTSPHNFKAGALNTLLRVSSVMTNAPIFLTLDCDMCSNDPQAPQRALCYLLDPSMASKLSFVQFPQRYRGLDDDDIYGGELRRLFRINSQGLDGLCGPNYVGTGCFFVRRSLFGPPSSLPSSPSAFAGVDCTTKADVSIRSDGIVKKAHEVAGCRYELHTMWGSMIGFRYGSLVEDYYTGYRLHCEGWRSVFCDPERPAFLGDSPRNLNDGLSQCRRWVVGLYEVAFSRFSPLTYGTRKASFSTGLCYAYYAFWGAWCIPITVYALIPQLGLIYDTPLFPKVSSTGFCLYTYLFLASYCHDLIEFLRVEGTTRRWWSDQRMWMIRGLTSFSFGTMEYALNRMGVSAPGFSLTSKVMEDDQNALYDKGVFYFGVPSPFFTLLGTVAITNLSSLVVGVFKATRKEEGFDEMFLQIFISGFAVLNCLPVIEAMFIRRDGGRIPRKITNLSILLAGLLCSFGYFIF